MTDGFSVLAIEKVDGRREVLGRWDSFPRFCGWEDEVSWLSWEDFRVFQEKPPTLSRKSPTFFQKTPTFLWESPTFLWKCWTFFCAVFVFSFGLKIVLIFCCSVKVVKAKSAKVQGCARVSPAREKTTAVWMPLGHRVMSRPRWVGKGEAMLVCS